MTTIAYIRVSSDKQTCSNQHFTIKEYAKSHNIHVDKWVEETISSRKPLEKRELGKLLNKMEKGSQLIVTEISRLARNLYELAGILQDAIKKEIIVISVEKNYNIDYLLKEIKKLQTSKNVYVVGHTNAGKSTLINKLIKNYSENSTRELTMSPLPSTTLASVQIEINDHLTLIDTPGLVDSDSLINYVDSNMLKKISPKKEIKPRTYQLRKGQSLVVEDFLRIDYKEGEKNSFTLFISNDLKVKRFINPKHDELRDKNKTTYTLKYDTDLVINGLGFVKIVNKGTIDVYIDHNIKTFTRSSLI